MDLAAIASDIQISDRDIDSILKAYSEKHRSFHTIKHIEDNAKSIRAYGDALRGEMLIANLYHDFVYNPRRSDNEERSLDAFMKSDFVRRCSERFIGVVTELILGTKLHDDSKASYYVRNFNIYDRSAVLGDLPSRLHHASRIYYEYQFAPYADFVEAHLKVVNACCQHGDIELQRSIMVSRALRVGIYAGSFNPLHNGHKDVIDQACAMFDKVVIARGQNPDKRLVSKALELQDCVLDDYPNLECIEFSGSIIDLYKHYSQPNQSVTLVRGVRDGDDLKSELRQKQFVQEQGVNIPYVFLAGDAKWSHVSSSSIRALEALGLDTSRYV